MAINVQIKDNNGLNGINGINGINGCCTGTFNGVESIGTRNWYGQDAWNTNVMGLQAGIHGDALINGGIDGDLSLLGSRVGLNLGSINGVAALGQNACMGLGSMSKEQVFIASLANGNMFLAQAARKIAMFDAAFISELAQIAFSSKWLAIKILEVATINLSVARTLVRLSALNTQLAASIAMTAAFDMDAAIARLGSIGLSVGTLGYAGVTGIQAGAGSMIGTSAETVRVNMHDNGRAYVIEADVAGRSIDDVDVTIDGGMLVIEAAACRVLNTGIAGSSVNGENAVGLTWRRQFALGTDIKVDDISARIVNGVLTVVLPRCHRSECTTSSVRQVGVAA